MKSAWILLLCAALFLFARSSLFAQQDVGTIVGIITDPQAGRVVSAKVIISEEATGLKYSLDRFER